MTKTSEQTQTSTEHQKSHGASFCIIYSMVTDRFLVELRSSNVSDPLHYGFFGGAIDSGESPRQACIREVKEETGLNFRVFDMVARIKNSPVFVFVKVVMKEPGIVLSHESLDFAWIHDMEEVRPWHRKVRNNMKFFVELLEHVREYAINTRRPL